MGEDLDDSPGLDSGDSEELKATIEGDLFNERGLTSDCNLDARRVGPAASAIL